MKYISDLFMLVVINLFILMVLYFTPYRWLSYYASSDSILYLPVAESILNGDGIDVDEYKSDYPRGPFVEVKGHLFNRYPLGNSIAALPFVALANFAGKSMHNPTDNVQLQFLLSFLSIGFFTSFGYFMFRKLLGLFVCSGLMLGFTLGSSVISSMGLAFWSHNIGVCLALITLAIIRAVMHNGRSVTVGYWAPLTISILLFFAYLCRPTFMVLAPCVFASLWIYDRKSAWVMGGTAFVLFAVISLFYYSQMGDFRAPYELSQTAAHYENMSALERVYDALWGAYGHFISPGRGLLLYSPFIFLGLFVSKSSLKRFPLLWICVVWIVLHSVLIISFPGWKTGWNFGPRLWVDVMPAFLVCNAVFIDGMVNRRRVFVLCVYALLLGWSIYVNTFQGVFNVTSAKWCKVPDVDQYPEVLFMWRYPQFFATQEQIDRRLKALSKVHPELQGRTNWD